ncbi:hypothetical protein psyc5s11_29280 [Clostridium gelidum]|uniref:Uncharacterized protein n=1 Tax=Clostridium gelidum TaxID=704125 RepID=A0ABN6J1L1_9CLOT|nr:hypothetical protein [Clostridium gelidum]BCZ46861.1 hypothetical protein psyc5s11_29280 [Clostridium gelidum]
MKKILEEVKADYEKLWEKRVDRKYDLLHTLYDLVPCGFKDKLEYNDEYDELRFDGKFISDLESMDDISGGYDGNLFKYSIDFTRDKEKEFMFLKFRRCKDAKGNRRWNKYLLGEWDAV